MTNITVIMATQGEPDLEEALTSLEIQTLDDFTVILVNDGGPDLTVRVSKFIGLSITLIQSNRNRGLAASLNAAIDNVETPYIARMDADDYNLPYRFEIQKRILESNGFDLLGNAVIKKLPNGKLNLGKYSNKANSVNTALSYKSPLPHPTFFGKTELFKSVKYNPDIRYSQDYDFLARARLEGYTIGLSYIPALIYNQSPQNKTPKQYYQIVMANRIASALQSCLNTNAEYNIDVPVEDIPYLSHQALRLRQYGFNHQGNIQRTLLAIIYLTISPLCYEQMRFNIRNLKYKFLAKFKWIE